MVGPSARSTLYVGTHSIFQSRAYLGSSCARCILLHDWISTLSFDSHQVVWLYPRAGDIPTPKQYDPSSKDQLQQLNSTLLDSSNRTCRKSITLGRQGDRVWTWLHHRSGVGRSDPADIVPVLEPLAFLFRMHGGSGRAQDRALPNV